MHKKEILYKIDENLDGIKNKHVAEIVAKEMRRKLRRH